MPMSGLVVQHIPTSTSVLEVDDFSTVADCHECEDHEQIYDTGDLQVEEILDDDGSEDEKEMEEDVMGANDECYDTDGSESVSSISEDEDHTDTIVSFEAHDIAENGDICESENVDLSEDIVFQNSHRDNKAFGYTSNNSGVY